MQMVPMAGSRLRSLRSSAKPVKFDFVGITTFTGFGIHIYMTTRFRQTSDFLEPERRIELLTL
jgi:hypothetical protein